MRSEGWGLSRVGGTQGHTGGLKLEAVSNRGRLAGKSCDWALSCLSPILCCHLVA